MIINVALGLIFNDQHELLIALRSAKTAQGNLWELPGGKVEAQECVEAALVREMHEELTIIVQQCQPVMSVTHDYAQCTVRLHAFRVLDYQGQVMGAEGQPVRWITLAQLPTIHFPAANKPIIDWLLANN